MCLNSPDKSNSARGTEALNALRGPTDLDLSSGKQGPLFHILLLKERGWLRKPLPMQRGYPGPPLPRYSPHTHVEKTLLQTLKKKTQLNWKLSTFPKSHDMKIKVFLLHPQLTFPSLLKSLASNRYGTSGVLEVRFEPQEVTGRALGSYSFQGGFPGQLWSRRG